jgi:hypothetical protein
MKGEEESKRAHHLPAINMFPPSRVDLTCHYSLPSTAWTIDSRVKRRDSGY